MFPDMLSTLKCAEHLLEHGIYAPPIVQVGVPKALPRIRFFISASHSAADIDRTIGIIEQFCAGESPGIRSHIAAELDPALALMFGPGIR